MMRPHSLPLLMAFDLDGTLLPDRTHVLPEVSAAALERLRYLGVKLAIITGRDKVPHTCTALVLWNHTWSF